MEPDAKETLLELVPHMHACGVWLTLSQQGVRNEQKSVGKSLAGSQIHEAFTQVDHLAQQSIEKSLEHFPGIFLIGEELTPHQQRYSEIEEGTELFLTIDPIDGTFSYTQGADGYCTMVSCFSKNGFKWGAINFPAKGRFLVSYAEEAFYRTVSTSAKGYEDAFLSDGFDLCEERAPNQTDLKQLAVHYRFLLEPFKPQAQRLIELGYSFTTLAGDPRTEWAKPRYVASNGALLDEVLSWRASAYIGSYTAIHDVAPLVSFFHSDSIQFYDCDQLDVSWNPLGNKALLEQVIKVNQKRCRLILANNAAQLKELEQCLRKK